MSLPKFLVISVFEGQNESPVDAQGEKHLAAEDDCMERVSQVTIE